MASRSSQPPAKKQQGGMGKPPAGGGGTKGKKRQGVLTVEQLEADSVSQLAAQYWRGDNTKPFSSQVIIKYKICYETWPTFSRDYRINTFSNHMFALQSN